MHIYNIFYDIFFVIVAKITKMSSDTQEFCPICSWTGKELFGHFQVKHEQQIVSNCFKELPNIKRKEETTRILTFNGFKFLVQIKLDNYILRHFVTIIENENLSALFSFIIKYSNEHGSIKKYKNTQEWNKRSSLNKNDGIGIELSTLFKEFKNYDDLKFILSIKMVETNCYSCKTNLKVAPIFHENNNYFCYKCHVSYKCQFEKNGCSFRSSRKFVLQKHEQWYCIFSNTLCSNCETNLKKENWFEHTRRCFRNEFLIDANVMTFKVLTVEEFYKAEVKAYESTFFCEWMVNKTGNMFMKVKTENKEKQFSCLLRFITIYDLVVSIWLDQREEKTFKVWSKTLLPDKSLLDDVIRNKKEYNLELVIMLSPD